ncbi:nuclear transport factor 2 family protein [Bifidobacterium bombi]|uniref:nuclear transport factor 2 family protein n=1 Tax=Bifidobacterium bombi TaxID=471511 RepID=UPI000B31655C|nr:nuclear transport factor 2 family protein [Bifidobacterium bombi]
MAYSFSMKRARSRERAITEYFKMWVARDFDKLDGLFAPDCRYEEYTGSIYQGRDQIHRWIDALQAAQVVVSWRVHDFLHGRGNQGQPEITVTWTFCAYDLADRSHSLCEVDGVAGQSDGVGAEREGSYEFDGVSIIEFDRQNKINSVREFYAKHDRRYPYGDIAG